MSLADRVGFGLLNVQGALSYIKNNNVTVGPPATVDLQPVSPVVIGSIDYKIEILSSLRIKGVGEG